MKEQPDKVEIRGEVAWRCHGCGTRVSAEDILLAERDGRLSDKRLLCIACSEKADAK